MGFRVKVICRHPLLVGILERVLSEELRLAAQAGELSLDASHNGNPVGGTYLFIFDEWSVHDQLTAVSRVLRVRCPGSKFLALLPLDRSGNEELLRLLYAGMDGVVRADEQWQQELVTAARGVLGGKLWFPREVIAEYVRSTNLLLNQQTRPVESLTPRESQVLQLMVRRFSNKEIGVALRISERTVKFHVSNIFAKLRVETRGRLYEALETTMQQDTPASETA